MLPKLPLAIETRRVQSFDGTDIAYHVTKAPYDGAPVVVLANGLGGTYLAWRAQIEALSYRYRFVTWDYRGLYGSKRPSPDVQASYAIANHVRDLEAVLMAEQVKRASLVGWSMGVQIVLESLRMLPGIAQNLVLLNGTYGRPLDTVSPVPGMRVLLPPLIEIARRMHFVAADVARRATLQPETIAWLKRTGLIGATLESAVFSELVHAFGQLDMETFFRNLRAISEHDASDLLEEVSVPTLVITGDRDLFTPRALGQQMARRIPTAEILLVRGGTHYTAIEFPELVSLRIDRFYRDHGY